MKISTKWLLAIGAVACAVLLAGTRVLADYAADIEATVTPNTTGITFDGAGDGGNNQAVVNALGGQPTTLAGRTYSTWVWFASDASGSLDLFDNSATHVLSGLAVGDVISATGYWTPYHGISEMSAPWVSATVNGSATPQPTPVVTIPQVTANPFDTPKVGPLSQGGDPRFGGGNGEGDADVEGYYLEIPNVTISGGGTLSATFPTYVGAGNNNVVYTITDASGNTMTMYDYMSSYELCQALGVNAQSTAGTVDIYGFADSFITTTKSGSTIVTNWGDEIVPLAVVSVIPEPSSFMLAGIGLLSLLAVIRRRRS